MSHLKLPPYQKSQRRSYAGFTSSQSATAQSNFSTSFQLVVTAPSSNLSGSKMANDEIPAGYTQMDHHVAGHTFHVGSEEIGMLKTVDDGSVLKPGGELSDDSSIKMSCATCDKFEVFRNSKYFFQAPRCARREK